MIEFKKDTHQYFLNGKELISVTKLMQKHGLAPDYSAVSQDVLERKAERGTFIHAEIEAFNKNGEIGFTKELENYIEYQSEKKFECLESELIVYNDICAGTLDLLLDYGGELVIADIKTTAKLHQEAVSWQLSIYNYLLGWQAEKAQAFHFDQDGNLKVVTIPFKPKNEVEKLMECERQGIYYKQDVSIPYSQLVILEKAQEIIEQAERQKKEGEALLNDVKDAIMQAMEKNAVKSFESSRLKITYVDAIQRTTIDTARLKQEKPDIVENYSKTTITKPSIRITLKEVSK